MRPATERSPLLAQAVRRGGTIGLVSPAGPVKNKETFAAGIRVLQELGFSVRIGPDTEGPERYLAADDATRAELFNKMWASSDTDAIMAVRGGFGSLRMAEGVDLDLIARMPKPFIGFSDITLLHSLLNRKTGLVTFHGPVVTSLASLAPEDIRHFAAMLTGQMPETLKFDSVEILRPKEASGRLTGGNLATLVSLIGTPYEPDWQGCIVFLEDVGEASYRIDRMLTQLRLAGKFSEINGLILGSFTDCGDVELVWQRALELTEDFEIPVWAKIPAGHGRRNLTLPFGLQVRLLPGQGAIAFAGAWLKEK